MANLRQLKIKHNRPIAHEVVFPEHVERSLMNSLRFVFMSYVYYKDFVMLDISKELKIGHSTVINNLTLSGTINQTINQKILIRALDMLKLDMNVLMVIAQHFQLSSCNAISFTEKYVVFFNAFKEKM